MGTIDFCDFCTNSKSITILCLLTNFGVISMTTDNFMDDLMLFEVYGKYIGFADFKVPSFTKTSIIFRTDACMNLELLRKTSNKLF